MNSEIIKEMGVFDIVGASFKLAFGNIGEYLNHLLPPFFLMSLGIIIALAPAFSLQAWGMENTGAYISIVVVAGIVGLVIFCKYFWEYLLVNAAVISMSDSLIETGSIGNGKAHIEEVRKRSKDYVILLLLLFLLSLVAEIVPHKGIGAFVSYLVYVFTWLSMPAFVLNRETIASKSIKESFQLVLTRPWRTMGLLITLSLIATLIFLPLIIFSVMTLGAIIKQPALVISPTVPISAVCVVALLGIITVCLIPLMSMACTLWYKKLRQPRIELR